MSIFKKKEAGPYHFELNENQFYQVWSKEAKDVKHTYQINTEDTNYNLLYRDGKYLGIPRLYGGPIYPFSENPTKCGTRSQKRRYGRAKVVCVSKDFELKVHWGSRPAFIMKDVHTQKAYHVGARGAFYVNINPTDAGRNADLFYNRCVTQRLNNNFDKEALRDYLSDAFVNAIGGKIQEFLEKKQLALSNMVGLQPGEFVQISRELYPEMKHLFASYGLTITEASELSLLNGMIVTPKE